MIYNLIQGAVFPENSSGQVTLRWPGGPGRLVVEGTFMGPSAKLFITATTFNGITSQGYELFPGLTEISATGQWNFFGAEGDIAFSWGISPGDSIPGVNVTLIPLL